MMKFSDVPEDARMLSGEFTDDFSVSDAEAGKRLDLLLLGRYGENTRSYLQNLIRNGSVTVNGKTVKTGFKARRGDCVHIVFPPPQEPDIRPENIPLDILYEDDDLLIVNKPKGMVVHPAPGHSSGTLVNALLYHCRGNLSGINGVLRPGIVHRIDRDTTGSLIVCKNDRAHQAVASQLKEHSVTRRYRAIVHGQLREDGTVCAAIGRHPQKRMEMAVNVPGAKDAVTHYHVLETFDAFTYIECSLETGRTHQIRVHMKSIGHPVLGDELYGPEKCPFPDLHGQMLHAMTIGLIHPTTGEYLEAEAPLPQEFERILQILRRGVCVRTDVPCRR